MRKRREGAPVPEDDAEQLADKRDVVKEAKETADVVVETSKKLKEELRKSEQTDNPLAWGNANRGSEVPVPVDMQRIIDTLVVDDPYATYQKLEKALRVGEHRSEIGVTAKALDESESAARLAHRLWITTYIAQQEWEAENLVVFGAMRHEATHALQTEKDKGQRNKTITNDDVSAMCAILYPDEWKSQEGRRRKYKAMVDDMKHLAETWQSRCRTLQTIHGKQR